MPTLTPSTTLDQKYLTWTWTREGFLILSGVVASVGTLKYSEPGKPPLVYVDETCLKDPKSLESLRGKSVTIDHTTEFVGPDNLTDCEVGRVSKVWYDPKSQQQCFSVLIVNKQLLAILQSNPKIKIGVSPYYFSKLVVVNGKITQRDRYYNNLSLLFLTKPRGAVSYVFCDNMKGKKMDDLTALQTKFKALGDEIAAAIAASTETTHVGNADDVTDEYVRGYAEGIEYGEARAYADSLSIAITPKDSLVEILEKVACKITGTTVKTGQEPAFYKGLIAGKANAFSDSKRVDPKQKTGGNETPAAKAEAARQKLIEQRYPETAAK